MRHCSRTRLMDYPGERLAEIWRTICLYQFHDILPGSAIAWVYREVVADHRRISDELTEFIHHAQELLAGRGDEEIVFDSAPMARPWASTVAMGGSKAPSITEASTPKKTRKSSSLITVCYA